MLRLRGRRGLPFVVAVVAVAGPAVVAAALALRDGWVPAGDRAVIAMRTRDVLGPDVPLLGMPSTVGLTGEDAGADVLHHPGPLEFWLLALPDRLAGSRPAGLAVGVALLNAAALGACVWVARRRGGDAAAAAVVPVMLLVWWSLGRHAAVDPWNATAVLFPFLACCFLAWAIAAGDRAAIVPGVLAGSYTAQSHVAFLVPVAALAVWSVAGYRFARRGTPHEPAGRTLVVAAIVGVAAWAGPLAQEVADFPGNLSGIAEYAFTSSDEKVPAGEVLRYVTHAVGVPPLFLRGRLPDPDFYRLGQDPPALGTLLTAAAVPAALLLAWWWARRAGRRDGAALAGTALVALAAVTVTLTRATAQFAEMPRYRLELLVPLGGFAWLALGWNGVAALRAARGGSADAVLRRAAPAAGIAGAAVASVAVVATLAAPVRAFAAYDRREDWRAIRSLAADAAGALDRDAVYRLESAGQRAYWGTGYGVARDLLRRGFDVRVPDGDVRWFFDGAHAARGEATHRLRVGPCAGGAAAGRVVARDALRPARATWPGLAASANREARRHLTAAGRAAAARPAGPVAALAGGDDLDPEALSEVVAAGYAELPTWLLFALTEAYAKEVTEVELCVSAGPLSQGPAAGSAPAP